MYSFFIIFSSSHFKTTISRFSLHDHRPSSRSPPAEGSRGEAGWWRAAKTRHRWGEVQEEQQGLGCHIKTWVWSIDFWEILRNQKHVNLWIISVFAFKSFSLWTVVLMEAPRIARCWEPFAKCIVRCSFFLWWLLSLLLWFCKDFQGGNIHYNSKICNYTTHDLIIIMKTIQDLLNGNRWHHLQELQCKEVEFSEFEWAYI